MSAATTGTARLLFLLERRDKVLSAVLGGPAVSEGGLVDVVRPLGQRLDLHDITLGFENRENLASRDGGDHDDLAVVLDGSPVEALGELLPGFVLIAPSRCLILRALPVQIDQQGFEVLPGRCEGSTGH